MLVPCGPTAPATESPASKPAPARIARLVEQLGSANDAEREAASKALEELGEEAVPAVVKALNGDNVEVKSRADEVLDAIEARAAVTKKAVLRLAGVRGAKLEEQAKSLAARVPFKHVMWVFKARARAGLGVRPNILDDGIELKIIILAKKPLTKAAMEKQSGDLSRMADITRAVTELTRFARPWRDMTAWQEYVQDMRQDVASFTAAVEKGDPVRLRTAAVRLEAACTKCHSRFRDE
jgi:hypothetical protein